MKRILLLLDHISLWRDLLEALVVISLILLLITQDSKSSHSFPIMMFQSQTPQHASDAYFLSTPGRSCLFLGARMHNQGLSPHSAILLSLTNSFPIELSCSLLPFSYKSFSALNSLSFSLLLAKAADLATAHIHKTCFSTLLIKDQGHIPSLSFPSQHFMTTSLLWPPSLPYYNCPFYFSK